MRAVTGTALEIGPTVDVCSVMIIIDVLISLLGERSIMLPYAPVLSYLCMQASETKKHIADTPHAQPPALAHTPAKEPII